MIFLILFIAFLLRLPGIGQSLWLDEAAQAIISRGSIQSIWIGNADFHPPVFHTLLHFWMKISTSETFMRLLPVLIGVVTVYIFYIFAKKHFGEKIANVSALLLAFSPYHIFYSQDLRSYSLLVLVSLISVHFFLEKKWKAYALINIISFFTNYVYVFVIFSELVLVLISKNRQNFKKFAFSQFPLLVLFIFWLPQFLIQLYAGAVLVTVLPEWRQLSSPNFVIAIPLTFFKLIAGQIAISKNPLYIFYAFILVSVVFWIFYSLLKKRDEKLTFFAVLVFLPIFLAWVVSFFIPLNNPPRLIFVLPFLYLLIAHYIFVFKDKHLIAIFILIGVFGIFAQNFILINRKEDWRGAVKFVESNTPSKNSTLVVFEFIAPFAPWQWYAKNDIEAIGVVPSVAKRSDLDINLSPSLSGKKTVYLFEYFADVTDPNRLVRKYLEENQFKEKSHSEFNNIGFIYEFWRPLL